MSTKDSEGGQKQAARPKSDASAWTEVLAACSDTVTESEPVGESTSVDFTHLTKQVPLARVLDQLGLLARLKG